MGKSKLFITGLVPRDAVSAAAFRDKANIARSASCRRRLGPSRGEAKQVDSLQLCGYERRCVRRNSKGQIVPSLPSPAARWDEARAGKDLNVIDGLTVTKMSNEGGDYATVLGTLCLASGQHSWNVYINHVEDSNLFIGVTVGGHDLNADPQVRAGLWPCGGGTWPETGRGLGTGTAPAFNQVHMSDGFDSEARALCAAAASRCYAPFQRGASALPASALRALRVNGSPVRQWPGHRR